MQKLSEKEISLDSKIQSVQLNLQSGSKNFQNPSFKSSKISTRSGQTGFRNAFNYKIKSPSLDDGESSAVSMEINLNSEKLHVLGLKNGELFWIETEECD